MSENLLTPPHCLELTEGNVSENFRRWRRQMEIYLQATGAYGRPKSQQKAIILHCAGPQAIEVSDQFTYQEGEDEGDPETLVKKLHDYCNPRDNEVLETFRFWKLPICSPFETYLTKLKSQANKCNFKEPDRMIRDKIVFSSDRKVQEKLLACPELSLKRTIEICRAFEQSTTSVEEIRAEAQAQVDKMERTTQKATATPLECRFCGRHHAFNKTACPAWGQTCKRCGERNHFARKCNRVKGSTLVHKASGYEPEWLNTINALQSTRDRLTAEFVVNGQRVKFQLDTGADVNIICKRFVKRCQAVETTQTLRMWNMTEQKPEGVADLPMTNPKTGKTTVVKFVVVGNNFQCLLGLKTCQELDLITLNDNNFVSQVQPTNDNLGDLGEAKLTIDASKSPVVSACRNIPFAYRDKVKKELDVLVKRKILVPVEEPTDWVSQMAIVQKKNGDLRICIDPQHLNRVLKREHYRLPTFEDTLPQFENAKVFSKLDVKEAYWHVRLDKESSILTTMITPYGRYRWTRLPFGLCVSGEIFQRKLSQALEGLSGCINVADDIIVVGCGRTMEEALWDHKAKLENLRERCKRKSIILNESKTLEQKEAVEFMGHVISAQGIKPDPKKVQAIVDMDRPTNAQQVRRFCGMVQYLSKFLSNLSAISHPLRELTKKETDFDWNEECEVAFRKLKEMITTTPVLGFYNAAKSLEIQVDSSQDGLGAVLMQEGKPLEYASRVLTPTEKRWAQIEKELLAVVFGLERFNQYTFGRPVTILNDHKPLATILQKPLNQAPRRLQNLIMRSNRYDFTFKWVRGNELYIADTLSRACNTKPFTEEILNLNIQQIVDIPDPLLDRIRNETDADETLQALRKTIEDGWPVKKTAAPAALRPYYDFAETLSISNGIIVKGERVLIPKSMRSEMKEKLHASHLAYDSMMRRARALIFWPGMAAEIKQMSDSCTACQENKPSNQRETLRPHYEGKGPWEKVGTDLMEIQGRTYLITVDYFSNWIEADLLTTSTSTEVIRKLKAHFARFGVPKVLISDCGPQYMSHEFAVFTNRWNISHIKSDPGHPKANGKAEAAVKTIKNMMRKTIGTGDDQYEALLELRNTPKQDCGYSPAQLCLNRITRSLLPLNKPLEPESYTEGLGAKARHRYTIKKHYDKRARDLPRLSVDQNVYFQSPGNNDWRPGKIIMRNSERSYTVKGTTGGTYVRNRVHIRPRNVPYSDIFSDDETATHEAPLDASSTDLTPHPALESSAGPDGIPPLAHGAEPNVRRSGRTRTTPTWHKDYDMGKW
ncbi:uncharacterized protein K02A2.6-like [Biomphalaria glabrata]|uniref:Uncharacterized protein K02A2.6-like n=1 Tax=Biomphalaria glabrata TaxID=6526 RepID=A0A9W3A8U1_BIOGL|nr:uncharacterized protein K02A2.6-like [Biomphalaria glabrata]